MTTFSLKNDSKPGHQKPEKKKSTFREYLEALLTAVFIALFLRSFVIEAFKIPSKSMVPTLMVGDHIFVNKFIYGIRIPFTDYWPIKFKEPNRGEVVVFKWPRDEKLDFIKRVVGLPGDRIKFVKDDIYINGQLVPVAPLEIEGVNPQDKRELLTIPPADFPDAEKYKHIPFSPEWPNYTYFLERLGEHTHVKQEANAHFRDGDEVVVPPDMFFAMGDNRDNSSDSREWGFVPRENLKGRAMFIWLSWDHDQGGIRWDRFGHWIQ